MEDYAPILWVLLFIGVSVYSATTKARKQAGKTEEKPHMQEAWPSWDPMSAPARPSNVDVETPESQYAELSEAPRPGFGMAAEATDYMPEQMHAQTSTPLTATGSSLASNTQTIETVNASESTSLADITEEFDLRRAVIYSEILKPKFDE